MGSIERSRDVGMNSRRDEGLGPRRARKCGPGTVRDWMSFRGATTKGARGQRGMHTFHGHEEDAGGHFDVGSTPHGLEEDPPPLGLTPDPEGRPQSEPKLGRWQRVTFQRVLSRRGDLQSAEQSHAHVLWSQRTKQKPTCSFTLR